MSGNGGMGGMPGSKKNKDMNKYKKGGAVKGDASMSDNWPNVGPKKARGGNKATKGIDFRDNMVKK